MSATTRRAEDKGRWQMSDNELRLRVAKALGWEWECAFIPNEKWLLLPGTMQEGAYQRADGAIFITHLPDWPNDIAAAWELEESLPEDKRGEYYSALWEILLAAGAEQNRGATGWNLIHASPGDRCRAWLAVMEGKGGK